ncbi:MAG: hypothetical protein R3Y64_04540 [Peptostreptococcaceae bacterium]
MNDLEKLLPSENCSICSHLYLDGPTKDFTYEIKCVFNDSFPNKEFYCELFKLEKSNLTASNINGLYIELLENCLRISLEEYKKTIHWILFENYIFDTVENKCVECGSEEDLEVVHVNKTFGRERIEDVKIVCKKCIKKPL